MGSSALPIEVELAAAEDCARHDLSKLLLNRERLDAVIDWLKEDDSRGLIRYGVSVGVVSPEAMSRTNCAK